MWLADGTTGEKVALVTGASSGIGRASALALAEAGMIVYATARRSEAVAALEEEGLRALRLDVTDEESAVSAVSEVEAEHGAVGVLVNNAGYGEIGPVEEVTLDAWRAQFETNLFGMVRMSQLVLPGMRARGEGRIVNIGSMGGEFTFPLGGAYHASKHAVESLSDALRLEVKPFGVRVVVLQPGVVDTPLGPASVEMMKRSPGSPYERQMNVFGERSRRQMERGVGIIGPERVAEVVVRAAGSRRPRARYKVGTMARILPGLRRWLPSPLWDAAIGSTLPEPARSVTLAGGARS